MVEFAPKWTPSGIAQRWRLFVGGWDGLPLFFAIGWFIWRAPRALARQDLRTFVRALRRGRRPVGTHSNIQRMRGFWLTRCFRTHNTCYVRAMTLYRFLDAQSGGLRLHLGIENATAEHDRLHAHAWVSLEGSIVEGPPAAYEGRVREIALERGA